MLLVRNFAALFIFLISVTFCPARGELRYQQDLTITSWKSQADIEEKVREFCNAAEGDSDIKIIDIQYKKGSSKKNAVYEAIITCHVAEIDQTFSKIDGKIFQKNFLLTDQLADK